MTFTRLMYEIRNHLNRGILDRHTTVGNLSREMMRKWEHCHTNIQKSNKHRMIQQLAFHTHQTIKATSTQDLDPRPLDVNDHVSILPHEMYESEPGETPSRILT